jgi:hypothetical protein
VAVAEGRCWPVLVDPFDMGELDLATGSFGSVPGVVGTVEQVSCFSRRADGDAGNCAHPSHPKLQQSLSVTRSCDSPVPIKRITSRNSQGR